MHRLLSTNTVISVFIRDVRGKKRRKKFCPESGVRQLVRIMYVSFRYFCTREKIYSYSNSAVQSLNLDENRHRDNKNFNDVSGTRK